MPLNPPPASCREQQRGSDPPQSVIAALLAVQWLVRRSHAAGHGSEVPVRQLLTTSAPAARASGAAARPPLALTVIGATGTRELALSVMSVARLKCDRLPHGGLCRRRMRPALAVADGVAAQKHRA